MPPDEKQPLARSDADARSPEELFAPSPVETFSEHVRPDSVSGIREGVRRPKLAPGTVVAGRFEIVRVLRHGGMGTVCLVHHRFLGRPMALKVVVGPETGVASGRHVESNVEAARERLSNEGRIAARLRHPNVVTVHDAGIDPELGPYVAMELLEGQTLRDWMSEPRDTEACLDVLEGLLEGAAAVHAAGLVHRDLTPENAFLHREGEHVVVKLLDFGLASDARPAHVGPQLTRPGDTLGKPHYRAPEQLRDPTGPCDARADVWSIGVIAHELLTGRLPVLEESAENGRVVLRRQQVDEHELGVDWARLVGSCIDDDPARRPSDARVVLRELRALRAPARQGRWGVVAGAALMLAGLLVATLIWNRATTEPSNAAESADAVRGVAANPSDHAPTPDTPTLDTVASRTTSDSTTADSTTADSTTADSTTAESTSRATAVASPEVAPTSPEPTASPSTGEEPTTANEPSPRGVVSTEAPPARAADSRPIPRRRATNRRPLAPR